MTNEQMTAQLAAVKEQLKIAKRIAKMKKQVADLMAETAPVAAAAPEIDPVDAPVADTEIQADTVAA